MAGKMIAFCWLYLLPFERQRSICWVRCRAFSGEIWRCMDTIHDAQTHILGVMVHKHLSNRIERTIFWYIFTQHRFASFVSIVHIGLMKISRPSESHWRRDAWILLHQIWHSYCNRVESVSAAVNYLYLLIYSPLQHDKSDRALLSLYRL